MTSTAARHRTAHNPIKTRHARQLRAGIRDARLLHGLFGRRGRLLTYTDGPEAYRSAFNRTAHVLSVVAAWNGR
ncbi:hypothetical protein [Curtobacterium sp. PhB146]|uniref:hypothetical protein n=1 Tax=Curtobacterium sp. PhB146 TaxID=2485187 RepID=UPI001051FA56|nr:hypothetical protein [Curtobacterium sp. PhB146]TCU48335.1 hypothetical protein EDF33_102226 [Curtobacterium sp. PhB146]